MGQSKPRPSRLFGLKSYSPMRNEMRPQWFVRPPSMRERHQRNSSPGAVVYGSPSTVQPPIAASKYPNGFFGVPAARRGAGYGHWNMYESLGVSQLTPASSISTFAPACVSTYAVMPPAAP